MIHIKNMKNTIRIFLLEDNLKIIFSIHPFYDKKEIKPNNFIFKFYYLITEKRKKKKNMIIYIYRILFMK